MKPHTITKGELFALSLTALRIESNARRLEEAAQASIVVAQVRADLSGLAADIRTYCGLDALTQANLDALKTKASS
jgi:hypothetical protein